MSIKKPLLSNSNPDIGRQDNIWIYDCGYESGDNGTLKFQDFSAVEFGGSIVWQQEKNATDEVPDYVYVYEDFNNPGSDVQYWSTSSEEGYVEAGYNEGYFIRWDLNGNVLYDSRTKN